MSTLNLLAIVRLLLVISPCHEMNMTHSYHLNLNRHGYISGKKSLCRECVNAKHVRFSYWVIEQFVWGRQMEKFELAKSVATTFKEKVLSDVSDAIIAELVVAAASKMERI